MPRAHHVRAGSMLTGVLPEGAPFGDYSAVHTSVTLTAAAWMPSVCAA